VLVKCLGEYQYIIQIDKARVICQARHHQFHDVRELAGSICETKGKDLKAPLPLSRDEHSLIMVALVDLSLPVTPAEVTGREEFAAVQSIQASVSLGQGKLVFDGQAIELPVVNA